MSEINSMHTFKWVCLVNHSVWYSVVAVDSPTEHT